METTDYAGMFVYKDYHIDYIQTSEGRLKWNDHDSVFYAEYFIKDHLGNVRSVVNSDTNQYFIAQASDYYPFGMEIEEGSKKEWERQKRSVEDQRNKLNAKSDRLAVKAENRGWNTDKLANKQGNLCERISSLNSSLETMGTLESSSQVYRLSSTESGENSGISLDTKTSVIDILKLYQILT